MNKTLQPLIDRLIPADDFPSGWEAGVGDYIFRHWYGDLARFVPIIETGIRSLNAECTTRYGKEFADLDKEMQDFVLECLELNDVQSEWVVSPQRFLQTMTHVAMEGYYSDPDNGGNRKATSWSMVGFRPEPKVTNEPVRPTFNYPERFPLLSEIEVEYDAIVVGAGAAGGIVASVLAEAGQKVLLLDRGRWLPYAEVGNDHLRNHRLALYGHNTGPELEGNPRVFVDPEGHEHLVAPHEGGYNNNAMTVGGGTRVYGGQAWRFFPADFRMASTYGVPEGSSLADWPISYEDLEPYYERAEWEIGVAGADQVNTKRPPRRRGYPMPPVPDNPQRIILRQAADRLGWGSAPVPLLINTQPYQGRPACNRCGLCVGFACATEAKNGTHNTAIPRALATGNCTLLPEAQASHIQTDEKGRATAVEIVRAENDTVVHKVVRAAKIIVSAGAIESARLLLNSVSSSHPKGIGNNYDQVGRNLQGHVYTGAGGLFDEITDECEGPGVSISTCDFHHGNPGVIGGGLLANEFTKLPIIFWRGALPPDLRRWGLANKQHMRHYYQRTIHIQGPIQDIPNPASRVTVASHVKDRFGIPVVRLSGTAHPESLRTAEFMRGKAGEWLRASDAKKIWLHPLSLNLSAGQHQAGTCRMGDDPQTSVTDRWGRVHGHDNLFVIDGSLHVTNGGFNPVLTIMALAYRCAEQIAHSK
ncbi:MAG: GMC family oxidoreductase [Caldilineaceae bacterium]